MIGLKPNDFGNIEAFTSQKRMMVLIIKTLVLRVDRMQTKIAIPFAYMLLLSLSPAFGDSPFQEWQNLMVEGSSYKLKGKYERAVWFFTKGVDLAREKKLPAKCLPIALCRETEAEVLNTQLVSADIHSKEIIQLVKQQSEAKTLESEISVWLVDLANAYQNYNKDPRDREDCLKHACLLKKLTFGAAHKETVDCMMQLANYYVDQKQIEQAVKVLETLEIALEKKYGKNPSALGDMINQLAIKCKTEHKYEQAKQLEMRVIKMANTKTGSLKAGLPAFYLFLGMNAAAQGKVLENKGYFNVAKKQCSRIKGARQKQDAKKYLTLLIQPSWLDRQQEKLALAEAEFKQILSVQEMIFRDPREYYGALSLLAGTMHDEDKFEESGKCLLRAISIAKLPESYVAKDLPDLYMRLATDEFGLRKIEKANQTFVYALTLETDTSGPHTVVILFWWSRLLQNKGMFSLALEKLNAALKIVTDLPIEKRGTLKADILSMLSEIETHFGRKGEAKLLSQQSSEEIQIQRKIGSKLGPDIFCRITRNRTTSHI